MCDAFLLFTGIWPYGCRLRDTSCYGVGRWSEHVLCPRADAPAYARTARLLGFFDQTGTKHVCWRLTQSSDVDVGRAGNLY